MSNFQKNFTLGKELLFKAVGKIDASEHSLEYTDGNVNFKNLMAHYSKILSLNKKQQALAVQMASLENEIAQEIIDYSQTIKIKTPRSATGKKEDNYDDVALTLQTLGASLQYLSGCRLRMYGEINDILQTVDEMTKDSERVEEAKQLHRQTKLDYDVLDKKVNSAPKSGSDLLKYEQSVRDHQDKKKDAESFHQLCLDHFAYIQQRRDITYTTTLKRMIGIHKKSAIESTSIIDQIKEYLVIKDGVKIDMPKYLTKEGREDCKVFGVDVEEIMKRKDETESVPKIFKLLIDYLTVHGKTTEGIFRINGTANEVKRIEAIVDSGKSFDLASYDDVSVIASLFKGLLRKSPNSLVPVEMNGQFIDVVNSSDKTKKMMDLIRKLPSLHRICLGMLLEMLYNISLNSTVNKMTPPNLAVCFGPNVLKNQEEDPMLFGKESIKINSVVETMITLYPGIKSVFQGEIVEQKTETKTERVQEKVDPGLSKVQSFNLPLRLPPTPKREEVILRSTTSSLLDHTIDNYMGDPQTKLRSKTLEDDNSIEGQIKNSFKIVSFNGEYFPRELISVPLDFYIWS
jgi:hypothetical protein